MTKYFDSNELFDTSWGKLGQAGASWGKFMQVKASCGKLGNKNSSIQLSSLNEPGVNNIKQN